MATNGYILRTVRQSLPRPTAWAETPRTHASQYERVRVSHPGGRIGLAGEKCISSGLDVGDGYGLPCRCALNLSVRTFESVNAHSCLRSGRSDATPESLRYFSPLLISRCVLRGPRRKALGPRSTMIRPVTIAPHRGNPGARGECVFSPEASRFFALLPKRPLGCPFNKTRENA